MAKKRQVQTQVHQPVFSPLVFGTTLKRAQPANQGMALQRNQVPELTPNLESPQKKQKKVSERLLGDPNKQTVDPATGVLVPYTGLVAFGLGTHSQMGRVRNYGGAGSRLGSTEFLESQVILLIQLNYNVLDWYNQMLKAVPPFHQITEGELLDHIKRYIYNPLVIDIELKIEQVVPSDSGRLRNTMKLSLGRGSGGASSMISGLNPFSVVVNTGRLNYAGPVNNMPGTWLKHTGLSHQNRLSTSTSRVMTRKNFVTSRGQKGHLLLDPDAESHWFEEVVTFGRIEAQQRWNNYITAIFPNWKRIQEVDEAHREIQRRSQQFNTVDLTPQFIGQSFFEVSFS